VITVDGNRLLVSGPATFETHVAMREESAASVADADVEIDLAGITEVDSTVLALAFYWQRRARQLKLVNPPQSLLALADLYGVVELLLGPDAATARPSH
jgi:phospholipid transport system transporter-binding protein